MGTSRVSNDEIANMLLEIADQLEQQNANPHRVRAYREGARTVQQVEFSFAEAVTGDEEKDLTQLPAIGSGLASAIEEMVRRGRSSLLDRLKGEQNPADLFQQVPGIGGKLAERIVDELGIETLEELELAAHEGRLKEVEGFGDKRVESIKVSLSGMLSRSAQRLKRSRLERAEKSPSRPPIDLLLALDKTYRLKSEQGELEKIAPRRFNPEGKAWLPIMHADREGWSFTLLYSNTARAHNLEKTRDWVVIYYEKGGESGQSTVVTGQRGELEGKRVVRGREEECRDYYERT